MSRVSRIRRPEPGCDPAGALRDEETKTQRKSAAVERVVLAERGGRRVKITENGGPALLEAFSDLNSPVNSRLFRRWAEWGIEAWACTKDESLW